MLYFGKYALAMGAHLPLGMAGAMLPYCCRPQQLHRQLHGWAFAMSALAFAVTMAGLGSGFILFLWTAACIPLLLLGKVSSAIPAFTNG